MTEPDDVLAALHARHHLRVATHALPTSTAAPPCAGRFEGMLLGLAVGDALGNTSESLNPPERAARFGLVTDYLPHRFAGNRRVGLPSDDTQLCARSIEALLDTDGRFDADVFVKRYRSRTIFGIGQAMHGFIVAGDDGVDDPWALGQESAGNGALMRIAAMLTAHRAGGDTRLARDALLSGALTHNDLASNACCVAFALMLRELTTFTAPPTASWWMKRFIELARPLEGTSRYDSRTTTPWSKPLWQFVEENVTARLDDGASARTACDSWWSGAYLLETMPSVLFILARHAHEPEEALIRAVNDTRDNDTVAAIVGAAVGALHGPQAVARWRPALLGRTAEADDGHYFNLIDRARLLGGWP